jgi:RAB protein geranylgeranyltransferase component A
LLKLSRRFSIDLCPNIFYARGQFIELLISSDVSKYCEFRLITQILTLNKDGKLEKVPTSRSEVFKTDKLSMIEKRHMMKFIQACMKDNDFQDLIEDSNSKMSFSEFVREKKLSESITNFIINAVAMAPNEDQSVADGLKEMKKFLSSVGRFGDSPFLYSLYGTGELPQCFCRMAAVFGAIYHLNMTIKSFQTNSDTNL